VLGQIAVAGAGGELFDFDAQARRLDKLIPEYPDRFVPIYGPQVSLVFAPFARCSYEVAVAAWLMLTALLYGLCCFVVWRALPALGEYRWLTLIGAAAFPPFYLLIANGQTTALALVCVTSAFFALKAGRPWFAGLALGSLFYKPSLGLVLPF